MNASLFLEYIDKYFKPVIAKITEKINGKSKEETLLHKTMLTEEYSADLSWNAAELNRSIVAADVVSMDSSLPLKRRDSFGVATGKLPKMGIKYRKGEKTISDINIMSARGADEATIASKVFDDVPKVIKGVDTRTEIMFLQGLSTGQTVVDDPENVGTGIRVSYGYKPENQFKNIGEKWESAHGGETPNDDVRQLFDKAQEDGNSIGLVMLSKRYFNLWRSSMQGKMLAANYNKQVYTDKALLAVPSRQNFLEALEDEFGCKFRVVDSTFKVEKQNGERVSVKPWEEANIVALPGENVGRLVYGTLAEETNPVAGVSYQKSGSHILVAKFSKTDPLEEYTTGQALCLPVIDGADGIYLLDANAAGAFTMEPKELNFPAEGGTQMVKLTNYVGEIKFNNVPEGFTATFAKGYITVKAKKNEGEAIEKNINISFDDHTAVIKVKQEKKTEAA